MWGVVSRLWAIILRCGGLWAGHRRWLLNSPPSHRQLLSRWRTQSCNRVIMLIKVHICLIRFFTQSWVPFDIEDSKVSRSVPYAGCCLPPVQDFQQEIQVILQRFPGQGSPWEHLQLSPFHHDQRHEDLPEPAGLSIGGFPAGLKLTTNGWDILMGCRMGCCMGCCMGCQIGGRIRGRARGFIGSLMGW